MKKKIIILAITTALVGTAAAMSISKKNKQAKANKPNDGSDEEGGDDSGGGAFDPCAARRKDTSAYGLKVMVLQERVGIRGCDKDGIVGPQTNGAVKSKYPTLYSGLGGVTPANIDKYLAARQDAPAAGGGVKANLGDIMSLWKKF